MSEDRLIIKAKPAHHRHRFVAGVGLGLLLVLGIWGLQLRMTFARYQGSRGATNELKEAAAAIQTATQAADVESSSASLDELRALVEQTMAKETAKDQVLDKVSEQVQTQMSAPSAGEQPVTPVVAGEETEIK